MTDQDFLEQFQIIFDNMATKEDVKALSSRMTTLESRMAALESRMTTKEDLEKLEVKLTAKIDAAEARLRQEIIRVENRLNSSIISKTATDDDIERIANWASG